MKSNEQNKLEVSKSNNERNKQGKSQNKSGNRGRNRRNERNSKSDCKGKEEPKNLNSTKGDDINDSTFYYSEPELLNQIVNFSFNEFLGVPFKLTRNNVDSAKESSVYIPTIMQIRLNPSAGMASIRYGLADDEIKVTDGVFKAGLRNYYRLSSSNAKTTNYQPQDVTMLIFALSSVFEMLSFTQRILGTPYIFNIRNRDLPKQLVECQGVNYGDLCANLANYRIRLNTIIQLFNKIPVPLGIRAFRKSVSLYSNYYTDDTSPMAQFYVLIPDELWEFDENTEPGVLTSFSATNTTGVSNFSVILDKLELMINKILESATFNFIFADILRLAEKGEMKINNYGLIPDGYIAPVLYSHEFNLWIDNAIVLGHPLSTAVEGSTPSNMVSQNISGNTLNYSPIFDASLHNQVQKNYVLNFDENNPNVEDKVAATRLVAGTYVWGADNRYKAVCSTHYITDVKVEDMGADGNKSTYKVPQYNLIQYSSEQAAQWFIDRLKQFDIYSKFKHAPHMHMYDGSKTTPQSMIDSSDYDYYTTVDLKFLSQMFDAEWITYLSID